MLVTISDINGPLEAIFAAGLKEVLALDGVTVECPSSPGFPPSPAMSEREAAGVTPAPAAPPAAPSKGKPGRKPKAVEKRECPRSLAPAEGTTRLTNRDRVAAHLRQFPGKTTPQIAAGIGLENSQVSNLLWNMKKAEQARSDEEGCWYFV